MLTDFLTLGEAGVRPYAEWRKTTTLYYPVIDENPEAFLLSRAGQRATLLARNYTDIVFYADNRGNPAVLPEFSLWDDPDTFRARAQECIDDGLSVHVFLSQKGLFEAVNGHVPPTIAEVKAAWSTFVPAVDDLVTTWCVCLEGNRSLTDDEHNELGAHLRTLTAKPIAGHFLGGNWIALGPWMTDIWYQHKFGSGSRTPWILKSYPGLLEKAVEKGLVFTAFEYNHQTTEVVSMLLGKLLRELGVTSFGNGIGEVEWAPVGEVIGGGPVIDLAAILDAIASNDLLRAALEAAICHVPDPVGEITFVGADVPVMPGKVATVTPTIHASAVADDFMVALVTKSAQANSEWADDGGGGNGWVKLLEYWNGGGKNREVAIYYKLHSGSETNPTFTHGIANGRTGGAICVFRGVDPTTPWDVIYDERLHVKSQTNLTNPTPKAITTVTDGARVFILGYLTDYTLGTHGPSAGYTLRVSNNHNDANLHGATKKIATAGVETPGPLTNSGSSNGEESTFVTLALRPAAVIE